MDELQAIANRHGLALIDDSCEALGARYKGRPLGAQGQDAVWAFYPNKQITTGEGGVVTTSSEETWKLLKSLRNQGRADGGGWLDHARLGFNYRIDDIRAAIGIGQLEKLDRILAGRTEVAARYDELLADIDGLVLPCPDDDDHERSWFVYVVELPEGADREAVIRRARGARHRHGALPAVHPPAELHAGALRLQRGALPGRGGQEPPHARAPVPRAPRGGRPGLRRRGR